MSLIASVIRRTVTLTVPIALFAGTVATVTTPIQADAAWSCISYDTAAPGPTSGSFPSYGLKAEISIEASGSPGNCTIQYKFSFNLYPAGQADTDTEGGIGIEDTFMPQGVNLAIEAAPLHIRVWKCGSNVYDNDVLWYFTSPEIWYETPAWNYGGCGPQADDYSSWFITNGYGAGTTYVNENS